MKVKGECRLFPTLKRDKYDKLTAGFSKVFNAHLRRIGIVAQTKVFHSFRHTFRDACRDALIDEELSDALMGHSGRGRVGRNYGKGYPMIALYKAICRIHYEGVVSPVSMLAN